MVTECRQRDRSGQRPRVLISVQNLQVPLDRRVWLECLSLTEAGYHVTAICPSGKDSAPYLVIDGVAIHTYPPYAPDGSKAGFVLEYAYSFLATARLASRARPRGRFDVIQAFNPPDIFWPLAMIRSTTSRTTSSLVSEVPARSGTSTPLTRAMC